MGDRLEEHAVNIAVVVAWYLISQYFAEVITRNYFVIETITLLLIFGLVYEVWTSSGGKGELIEAVMAFGEEYGRTGAQIFLLIGVGGFLFLSIFLRNWVESIFGPLAVVQLLAFVILLSRAFVNVRSTGNPLDIVDGTRETYLVYSVGVLGIVLSYVLRGSYHPATPTHNALVIFLSTSIPAVCLYKYVDERNLPSLKELVKTVS